MSENQTLRIAFDADEHTHRSLKILAAQNGTTVRSLICKALCVVLASHGVDRSPELIKAARSD